MSPRRDTARAALVLIGMATLAWGGFVVALVVGAWQ